MSAKERSELVATFLALLELVKNGRIKIDGEGSTADVSLVKNSENSKI